MDSAILNWNQYKIQVKSKASRSVVLVVTGVTPKQWGDALKKAKRSGKYSFELSTENGRYQISWKTGYSKLYEIMYIPDVLITSA